MTAIPPTETAIYEAHGDRAVRRVVPLRTPGAGEVVVAVAGSAVGDTPGDAIAGTVVAVGEAAREWLGRRVVVPRALPCGECDRCRRARAFACPSRAPRGPVAEHAIVPSRYLLSVEPPLWPGERCVALWQLAALADVVSSVYGALVRAQLGPGDVCIVVGGGVRGRAAIQLARAKGAEAFVVEADPALRQLAEAAGARLVLDGAALDPAAARNRVIDAARAAGLRALELRVVETTRTSAGRRRAVAMLDVGDTAALLGGGDDVDVTAPLATVAAVEGTIVGAGDCHPDLFPELAALVVRGDLDLGALVEQRDFDALASAIAEVRRGAASRLQVLAPRPAG